MRYAQQKNKRDNKYISLLGQNEESLGLPSLYSKVNETMLPEDRIKSSEMSQSEICRTRASKIEPRGQIPPPACCSEFGWSTARHINLHIILAAVIERWQAEPSSCERTTDLPESKVFVKWIFTTNSLENTQQREALLAALRRNTAVGHPRVERAPPISFRTQTHQIPARQRIHCFR